MFNIFFTDIPLQNGFTEPNLESLIPHARDTEEEALNVAMQLLNRGSIVWRINGPDGFAMNREQIRWEFFHGFQRWPAENGIRLRP